MLFHASEDERKEEFHCKLLCCMDTAVACYKSLRPAFCSLKIAETKVLQSDENISKVGDQLKMNMNHFLISFIFGFNYILGVQLEPAFKINITTILSEPFMFDQFGCRNNSQRVGLVKDILDLLSVKMNFAYDLSLVPDGKYGALDANRVWNGLVGEVLYNRTDMAAADLTLTAARSKVVSFTIPFVNVDLGLLFKKPTVEFDLFAFLFPFSTLVWILILVSLILISASLFLFSKILRSDEDPLANLGACFYFGVACLLAQGPETYPRSLFSRITAVSWWFFSLMIITVYTASLTSTLTLNRARFPLRSIENLIYQKEFSYGIENFQILEDVFRHSEYVPFQVMWDNMVKHRESSFYSAKEGTDKVRRNSKFAFIRESPYLKYAVTQPPCDLDFIISPGSPKASVGLAFAFPKDSKLTGKFSVEILNMFSNGQMAAIHSKWFTLRSQCSKDTSLGSSISKIGFPEIQGIFYTFLTGMALSFLLFLSNLIVDYLRKKIKMGDHINENNYPKL